MRKLVEERQDNPELIARELLHHCLFTAFKVIKIQMHQPEFYRKRRKEALAQLGAEEVSSEPEEVLSPKWSAQRQRGAKGTPGGKEPETTGRSTKSPAVGAKPYAVTK